MENQHEELVVAPLEQDGLSLEQTILLLKKIGKEVLFKFWFVVVIAAALGYYMYNKTKKLKTEYTSYLSFFLANEEQSGISSSKLEAIGTIEKALGKTTSDGNVERMLELMTSKSIIVDVLLDSCIINGNKDKFINHYLTISGQREAWIKDNSPLKSFTFTQTNFSQFGRTENTVFNLVRRDIGRRILRSVSKAQIITIQLVFFDETFTYEFLKRLFARVQTYFEDINSRSLKDNVKNTKHNRDSLSYAVEIKEADFIDSYDARQLGIRYDDRVEKNRLDMELRNLYQAFYSSEIAYNRAKQDLMYSQPLIKVLDYSNYPLDAKSANPTKSGQMGLLAGFVLGIVLVVARRVALWFFKSSKLKDTFYNVASKY